MNTEERIAIELFCTHEGIDLAFVEALEERGLIRIITVRDKRYLEPDHLPLVERLARMHYDLEINLEGLEAIGHLLERMEDLQAEMRNLRDRLRLYEREQ